MGVTNIHRAGQLMTRAGSHFEGQAFIELFHKPVCIVSATTEPTQLDRLSTLISKDSFNTNVARVAISCLT
jgi:hypothetical protein